MSCAICNSEKSKLLSCAAIKNKGICLNCCFAVSSGKPEFIKIIKNNHGRQKEDVLVLCEKCLRKPLN